jgi:hypothetical protein
MQPATSPSPPHLSLLYWIARRRMAQEFLAQYLALLWYALQILLQRPCAEFCPDSLPQAEV